MKKKYLIWLMIFVITIMTKEGKVYRLDDDYMIMDSNYWLGGEEPLLVVKLKKFKEKFSIPISQISKMYRNEDAE